MDQNIRAHLDVLTCAFRIANSYYTDKRGTGLVGFNFDRTDPVIQIDDEAFRKLFQAYRVEPRSDCFINLIAEYNGVTFLALADKPEVDYENN